MENRPEFVVIWLAVLKCGGTAALVNYNLKGINACIALGKKKVIQKWQIDA